MKLRDAVISEQEGPITIITKAKEASKKATDPAKAVEIVADALSKVGIKAYWHGETYDLSEPIADWIDDPISMGTSHYQSRYGMSDDNARRFLSYLNRWFSHLQDHA